MIYCAILVRPIKENKADTMPTVLYSVLILHKSMGPQATTALPLAYCCNDTSVFLAVSPMSSFSAATNFLLLLSPDTNSLTIADAGKYFTLVAIAQLTNR